VVTRAKFNPREIVAASRTNGKPSGAPSSAPVLPRRSRSLD
jgi:hypothetical protein